MSGMMGTNFLCRNKENKWKTGLKDNIFPARKSGWSHSQSSVPVPTSDHYFLRVHHLFRRNIFFPSFPMK